MDYGEVDSQQFTVGNLFWIKNDLYGFGMARSASGDSFILSRRFLVRREKALFHSGCESHPGTGSLRPVAIGAVVEATKLLKPPV